MNGAWPPIAILGLIPLLALIAYTDLTIGLIRNWQNGLVAVLGVSGRYFYGLDLMDGLIGGGCGLLIGIATNLLYQFYRREDGIGYGDVKLFGAAGIWMGWQSLAPFLLCASVLAIAFFQLQPRSGPEETPSRQIRFGPFLALSFLGILFLQAMDMAPWLIT